MKIIKFNESLSDIDSMVDDCFQEIYDINGVKIEKYVSYVNHSSGTRRYSETIEGLYGLLKSNGAIMSVTLHEFSVVCGVTLIISTEVGSGEKYDVFKWNLIDSVIDCIRKAKRMKNLNVMFSTSQTTSVDSINVTFYPIY